MDEKYYSVKEFSKLANVSQQAIYQQMNGRLLNYIKIINGKKKISELALKEFYQNIKVESSQLKSNTSELELMKTMVDMLQKELDRKDAALLEERKRVDELNEKLAAAYGQISEMANKAQYITAADKTEKILEMNVSSIPSSDSEILSDTEEPKNDTKKKKKWLFSWFK